MLLRHFVGWKARGFVVELEHSFLQLPKVAKCHVEYQRVAVKLQTNNLKILRNTKTRWIGMVAPVKWVLSQYKTLVTKMSKDADASVQGGTQICFAMLSLSWA